MSWRYLSHLLLLVGLTLIDPSEEGCLDYFKMDSWTEYASLTDPVDLVMLNNTKDIMECSVERAYLQSLSRTKNLNLFYILKHCFDRSNVSGISEKCRGETSEEILFYHFMCWTAKAVEIDVPPDYCSDYGTLCSIYAEISFPITVGSQKYNKGSTDTRDTDILNLKILLVISVILNVTVPVIVYLRMRLQKKQQMANGAWIWSDTDPKPNGNVEMVPLQNDA
ncbi:uncharacterized protein LOC103358652 isoform X2 [Stegastes partitus]|uniref:Uncharacterized protein LOC103358652 isoform X2 n=1 Tax=Stegastes partitus TaxID=144197 RepID=A0A9Y4MU87_9TELE|nr:PREDICTED: uncharacterized protein LOC103358652 isoform X2 [Stegastes partitus]